MFESYKICWCICTETHCQRGMFWQLRIPTITNCSSSQQHSFGEFVMWKTSHFIRKFLCPDEWRSRSHLSYLTFEAGDVFLFCRLFQNLGENISSLRSWINLYKIRKDVRRKANRQIPVFSFNVPKIWTLP